MYVFLLHPPTPVCVFLLHPRSAMSISIPLVVRVFAQISTFEIYARLLYSIFHRKPNEQ